MDDGRRRRSSVPDRADVRAAAARVLERTLSSSAPAEIFLAREGRGLDERDRRLLAELAYGSLRWKLRLEAVIEKAADRGLGEIDAELLPVLTVAAYQLFYLDRVPAHAVVSEAVEEARRRRGRAAAGFVNAVLRRLAGDPRLDSWPIPADDPWLRLAIEHSHPVELVRRWAARFGVERAERMLAADNGSREVHLLAFADRGGRQALARTLAAEGVATAAGRLAPQALVVREGSPFATEAFRRGDFYVQDEASQAAALVPAPRGGERVLDAAAAPGGKGLALLARDPSLRLLCADSSPARLTRLRANAARLGRRLPLVLADARRAPWRDGAFDRVLLDAPCSGTGTLRRHPELRWRFRASELVRLAAGTEAMLASLASKVAASGLLILLTCSVEAEENERVAARFLTSHEEFEAAPLDALDEGLEAGRGEEPGRWRVLPGDGHDGFSVAVFRRCSGRGRARRESRESLD